MSKNVVISRLAGGLGNQMFQYACGYAVAKKLNASLLLDNAFLKLKPTDANYTLRDFELDVFQLEPHFATPDQSAPFYSNEQSILRRLFRKINGSPKGYFKERSKIYNNEIEELSTPVYLDGYWQNEKYFHSCRNDLLSIFRPAAKPEGRNAILESEIRANNGVCVHVRRGDYVNNPSANQLHGTCTPEYYTRAAQLMTSKFNDVVFYVFSDDIRWVQNNIEFPGTTVYIDHNTGKSSYWDMYLMKQGIGQIIANSSFSWWGAWLCDRPGQQVVAPRQWFQGIQDYEITPSAWMLL